MAIRVDNSAFYQSLDDLRGRLGLGPVWEDRSRTGVGGRATTPPGGFPEEPGFFEDGSGSNLSTSTKGRIEAAQLVYKHYDKFGQYAAALTPPWRQQGRKAWQTIIDPSLLFTPEVFDQTVHVNALEGRTRNTETTRGRFFAHIYAEQWAWAHNRQAPANLPLPVAVVEIDRAISRPTWGKTAQGTAANVAADLFGPDAAHITAQLLAPRGNRGPIGTILVNMGVMLDKLNYNRQHEDAMGSAFYHDRPNEPGTAAADAARTVADTMSNLGIGVATFRYGMWMAESWSRAVSYTGQVTGELNEGLLQKATDAQARRPGSMGTRGLVGLSYVSRGFEAVKGAAFILESEVTRATIRGVAPLNEWMNGSIGRNYNADIDRIFSLNWYSNVETFNTHAEAAASLAARTRLTHGSLVPLPDGRWQVVFATTHQPMTYINRFRLVSEHMHAHGASLGGGIGSFLDFVSPPMNDDARLGREEFGRGFRRLLQGQWGDARLSFNRSADAWERSQYASRVHGQYGGGPARAGRAGLLGTVIGATILERTAGHFMSASEITLEKQVNYLRETGNIGQETSTYADWHYVNPLEHRNLMEAVPNLAALGYYGVGWAATQQVSLMRQAPQATLGGYAATAAAAAVTWGAATRILRDRFQEPYREALFRGRSPGLGTIAAYRGRGLIAALAAGAAAAVGLAITGLFQGRQTREQADVFAQRMMETPLHTGSRLPVQFKYSAGWDKTKQGMFESVAMGIAADAKNLLVSTQAYREGGTVLKMMSQKTATAISMSELARQIDSSADKMPADQRDEARSGMNYMLDRVRDWAGTKSDAEISIMGVEALRIGDLRSFGLVGVRLTSGSKSTYMASMIFPMPMALMVGGKLPFFSDWHKSKQLDYWLDSEKPATQPLDFAVASAIHATGGKTGWGASVARFTMGLGYEPGSDWEGVLRLGTQAMVGAGIVAGPTGYGVAMGAAALTANAITTAQTGQGFRQRMGAWWTHGIDPGVNFSLTKNLGTIASSTIGADRSSTRFWMGRLPNTMIRAAHGFLNLPTTILRAPTAVVGNLAEIGTRTAGRWAEAHTSMSGSWITRAQNFSWQSSGIGRAHRVTGVVGEAAMFGLMAYTAYNWLKANRRYEYEGLPAFNNQINEAEDWLRTNPTLNPESWYIRPGQVAASLFQRIVSPKDQVVKAEWDTYRYRMSPSANFEGGDIRAHEGQIKPGWVGYRDALGRSLGQVFSATSIEGLQTAMVSTGQTGMDIYDRIVEDVSSFTNPEVHGSFANNTWNLKTNVVMAVRKPSKQSPDTEYMLAKALGSSAQNIMRTWPGRKRPAFMGKMFLNTGMRGSSPIYEASPALRLALQQRFAVGEALLGAHPSEMRQFFGDYRRGRKASQPLDNPMLRKVVDWGKKGAVTNTDFTTYTISLMDLQGRPIADYHWGIENIDAINKRFTRELTQRHARGGMWFQAKGDDPKDFTYAGEVTTEALGSAAERFAGMFTSFQQNWESGGTMSEVRDDDAAFNAFPVAPGAMYLRPPTRLRAKGDFLMNWVNQPNIRLSMAVIGTLVGGALLAAPLGFMVGAAGQIGASSAFTRRGRNWQGGATGDDFREHLNRYRRERWGRLRGPVVAPHLTPAGVWALTHEGIGLAELELPIGPNRSGIRLGDHLGQPFSDLGGVGGVGMTAEQKAHHYRRIWHGIGNLYESIEHTRSSLTLLRSLDELQNHLLNLRPGTRPAGWTDSRTLNDLIARTHAQMHDITNKHVARGHAPFRVGELRGNQFVASQELRVFEKLARDAMYKFDAAANLRQVQFEPIARGAGLFGWQGATKAVNAWGLVEDPNITSGRTPATPPLGHSVTDWAQRNDMGPGLRAVRDSYRARGFAGAGHHVANAGRATLGAGGTVLRGLQNFVMTPLTVWNISAGVLASASNSQDIGGPKVRQAYTEVADEWGTSLLEGWSLGMAAQAAGAAGRALSVPAMLLNPVTFGLGVLAFAVPMAMIAYRPALEARFNQRRGTNQSYDVVDRLSQFDRTVGRLTHAGLNAAGRAVRRGAGPEAASDVWATMNQTAVDITNNMHGWAADVRSKSNTHSWISRTWADFLEGAANFVEGTNAAARAFEETRQMRGRSFSLGPWLSRSPIFWGHQSPKNLKDGDGNTVRSIWWEDAYLGYERQRQIQMMTSADPIGSSIYEMVAPETLGVDTRSPLEASGFKALYQRKGEGAGGLGNAGAARAFKWESTAATDSIIESELKRRAVMHEMAIIGGGLKHVGYGNTGGYNNRNWSWLGSHASGPRAGEGPRMKPLKRGEEGMVAQAIESATGVVRVVTGRNPLPANWDAMLQKWAHKYGVDPNILRAFASRETGHIQSPEARRVVSSPVGARGIMQVMDDGFAKGEDWSDPDTNFKAAARRARDKMNEWKGRTGRFPTPAELAGSYNAGVSGVLDHGAMTRYRETRNYVALFLKEFGSATTVQGLSPVAQKDQERVRKALLKGMGAFWSAHHGSVDELVEHTLGKTIDAKTAAALKSNIRNNLRRSDRWLSWDDPYEWQKRDATIAIRPTDAQRADLLRRAVQRVFPGKSNLRTTLPSGVHVETNKYGHELVVPNGYRSWTGDTLGASRGDHSHQGLDFGWSNRKDGILRGAPAVSQREGVVEAITEHYGIGGKAVGVRTGKFVFWYAHLDDITVVKGQRVPIGGTVGHIGITGLVNKADSNSHIHGQITEDGRGVISLDRFQSMNPLDTRPDAATAVALKWLEAHVGNRRVAPVQAGLLGLFAPASEAGASVSGKYNYDYIKLLMDSPIRVNGKPLTRAQANDVLYVFRETRENENYTQQDGPGQTGYAWGTAGTGRPRRPGTVLPSDDDDDYSPWLLGAAGALLGALILARGVNRGVHQARNGMPTRPTAPNPLITALRGYGEVITPEKLGGIIGEPVARAAVATYDWATDDRVRWSDLAEIRARQLGRQVASGLRSVQKGFKAFGSTLLDILRGRLGVGAGLLKAARVVGRGLATLGRSSLAAFRSTAQSIENFLKMPVFAVEGGYQSVGLRVLNKLSAWSDTAGALADKVFYAPERGLVALYTGAAKVFDHTVNLAGRTARFAGRVAYGALNASAELFDKTVRFAGRVARGTRNILLNGGADLFDRTTEFASRIAYGALDTGANLFDRAYTLGRQAPGASFDLLARVFDSVVSGTSRGTRGTGRFVHGLAAGVLGGVGEALSLPWHASRLTFRAGLHLTEFAADLALTPFYLTGRLREEAATRRGVALAKWWAMARNVRAEAARANWWLNLRPRVSQPAGVLTVDPTVAIRTTLDVGTQASEFRFGLDRTPVERISSPAYLDTPQAGRFPMGLPIETTDYSPQRSLNDQMGRSRSAIQADRQALIDRAAVMLSSQDVPDAVVEAFMTAKRMGPKSGGARFASTLIESRQGFGGHVPEGAHAALAGAFESMLNQFQSHNYDSAQALADQFQGRIEAVLGFRNDPSVTPDFLLGTDTHGRRVAKSQTHLGALMRTVRGLRFRVVNKPGENDGVSFSPRRSSQVSYSGHFYHSDVEKGDYKNVIEHLNAIAQDGANPAQARAAHLHQQLAGSERFGLPSMDAYFGLLRQVQELLSTTGKSYDTPVDSAYKSLWYAQGDRGFTSFMSDVKAPTSPINTAGNFVSQGHYVVAEMFGAKRSWVKRTSVKILDDQDAAGMWRWHERHLEMELAQAQSLDRWLGGERTNTFPAGDPREMLTWQSREAVSTYLHESIHATYEGPRWFNMHKWRDTETPWARGFEEGLTEGLTHARYNDFIDRLGPAFQGLRGAPAHMSYSGFVKATHVVAGMMATETYSAVQAMTDLKVRTAPVFRSLVAARKILHAQGMKARHNPLKWAYLTSHIEEMYKTFDDKSVGSTDRTIRKFERRVSALLKAKPTMSGQLGGVVLMGFHGFNRAMDLLGLHQMRRDVGDAEMQPLRTGRKPYSAMPTQLDVAEYFPGEVEINYRTEHITITGVFHRESNAFETTWTSKQDAPAFMKNIDRSNVYGPALLRLFKRLDTEHGLQVTQQYGDSLATSFGAKKKFFGDRFSVTHSYGSQDTEGITRLDLQPRRIEGGLLAEFVQAVDAGRALQAARPARPLDVYEQVTLPPDQELESRTARKITSPNARRAVRAGNILRSPGRFGYMPGLTGPSWGNNSPREVGGRLVDGRYFLRTYDALSRSQGNYNPLPVEHMATGNLHQREAYDLMQMIDAKAEYSTVSQDRRTDPVFGDRFVYEEKVAKAKELAEQMQRWRTKTRLDMDHGSRWNKRVRGVGGNPPVWGWNLNRAYRTDERQTFFRGIGMDALPQVGQILEDSYVQSISVRPEIAIGYAGGSSNPTTEIYSSQRGHQMGKRHGVLLVIETEAGTVIQPYSSEGREGELRMRTNYRVEGYIGQVYAPGFDRLIEAYLVKPLTKGRLSKMQDMGLGGYKLTRFVDQASGPSRTQAGQQALRRYIHDSAAINTHLTVGGTQLSKGGTFDPAAQTRMARNLLIASHVLEEDLVVYRGIGDAERTVGRPDNRTFISTSLSEGEAGMYMRDGYMFKMTIPAGTRVIQPHQPGPYNYEAIGHPGLAMNREVIIAPGQVDGLIIEEIDTVGMTQRTRAAREKAEWQRKALEVEAYIEEHGQLAYNRKHTQDLRMDTVLDRKLSYWNRTQAAAAYRVAPLIWRVYDEALRLAGREHPTVRAQRAVAERISRMNGTSLDPDVRESIARDIEGNALNRETQYADLWKGFEQELEWARDRRFRARTFARELRTLRMSFTHDDGSSVNDPKVARSQFKAEWKAADKAYKIEQRRAQFLYFKNWSAYKTYDMTSRFRKGVATLIMKDMHKLMGGQAAGMPTLVFEHDFTKTYYGKYALDGSDTITINTAVTRTLRQFIDTVAHEMTHRNNYMGTSRTVVPESIDDPNWKRAVNTVENEYVRAGKYDHLSPEKRQEAIWDERSAQYAGRSYVQNRLQSLLVPGGFQHLVSRFFRGEAVAPYSERFPAEVTAVESRASLVPNVDAIPEAPGPSFRTSDTRWGTHQPVQDNNPLLVVSPKPSSQWGARANTWGNNAVAIAGLGLAGWAFQNAHTDAEREEAAKGLAIAVGFTASMPATHYLNVAAQRAAQLGNVTAAAQYAATARVLGAAGLVLGGGMAAWNLHESVTAYKTSKVGSVARTMSSFGIASSSLALAGTGLAVVPGGQLAAGVAFAGSLALSIPSIFLAEQERGESLHNIKVDALQDRNAIKAWQRTSLTGLESQVAQLKKKNHSKHWAAIEAQAATRRREIEAEVKKTEAANVKGYAEQRQALGEFTPEERAAQVVAARKRADAALESGKLDNYDDMTRGMSPSLKTVRPAPVQKEKVTVTIATPKPSSHNTGHIDNNPASRPAPAKPRVEGNGKALKVTRKRSSGQGPIDNGTPRSEGHRGEQKGGGW